MTEIAVWRVNLLRLGYLLLVVGLSEVIWPTILDPTKTFALSPGLVTAFLGAFVPLALIGLRYPLQMLPLMFYEIMWKCIWLVRMVFPLWREHKLDAVLRSNVRDDDICTV